MLVAVDRSLVELFGSRTRAGVLVALAQASEPVSAYWVAKSTGAQKIKVSFELRRLEALGFVSKTTGEGSSGQWTLDNRDLRRLLSRPVESVSPSSTRARGRSRASLGGNSYLDVLRSLPDPSVEPEFYRPRSWKPTPGTLRDLRERLRPPEKDRLLRKYGGRTSYREGRRL